MTQWDEMLKKFHDELIALYKETTGLDPEINSWDSILFRAFEHIWRIRLIDEIKQAIEENPNAFAQIKNHAQTLEIFRQPSILLVYFWITQAPIMTRHITPMEEADLALVFDDFGYTKIFKDYAKKYA